MNQLPARILIVEDEPHTAEALKLYIENFGFDVIDIVSSSQEAIDVALSSHPDLIIMDIILEGVGDGITAAEEIHKQIGTPVLYLTAHDENYLFERAKITDPFAYILKPFNERELLLTINMALYRHETERKLRTNEIHLAQAQAIGNMGSWDWDIVSGHLHWSKNTFVIFGLNPDTFAATYEEFLASVHPDDREMVQEAVDKALSGKQSYNIEHRIVLPDGQERFVHEKARVTFDDAAKPIRMTGTVQDITERKGLEGEVARAKKMLDQSLEERTQKILNGDAHISNLLKEGVESKASAILEMVGDGVVTIDRVGIVESFNPAAEKIFGFTAREVIGQNIKMLMPEPYQSEHDGYIKRYTGSGDPRVIGIGREVVGQRKNGEAFPMALVVSEVSLHGENMFVGTVRDITRHKQYEERIQRSKEMAELATQAKSEFLANMSHELRTPLNAIIGFSDFLMSMSADERGSQGNLEYLQYINSSGLHLLELINDILDLSKIEAGKMEISEDDFDIRALIQTSIELVRQRAEEKHIELIVDIAEEVRGLHADERRVRQILLNLLSNATKFTPDKGRVEVRCGYDDGGLSICVRDTGIGMKPEDIELALEAFGQIDSSLARKYEGTGLGLPLVKELMEAHCGSLQIESEPGQGTSATIHFPEQLTIKK